MENIYIVLLIFCCINKCHILSGYNNKKVYID
uniref:Uncharacterized protein n=1 Tax=Anguilla anguilla TaxID=7936 RepID=A0A0E9XTK2_ANGAN